MVIDHKHLVRIPNFVYAIRFQQRQLMTAGRVNSPHILTWLDAIYASVRGQYLLSNGHAHSFCAPSGA